MTDVSALIYAITAFAGVALASLVGLAAFGKWIDLKRAEIDALRGAKDGGAPAAASRACSSGSPRSMALVITRPAASCGRERLGASDWAAS